MGLAAQEALKQPTWCRLQPEEFPLLTAHAHATAPENVLFTYKTHAAVAAAGSAEPRRGADGGAATGAAPVGGPSGATWWPGGPAKVDSPVAARQVSADQGSAAADGSKGAAIAAAHAAKAPGSGLGSDARREPGPEAALPSQKAGAATASASRRSLQRSDTPV